MNDPTHPAPEGDTPNPLTGPDSIPPSGPPQEQLDAPPSSGQESAGSDPGVPAAAAPVPVPPPVPPDSGIPEEEPQATRDSEPVYRNPFVIAAGALAAGVVFSRLLATPAGRRMAREISAEVLSRLGAGQGGSGRPAWDQLAERVRPVVTDYAKKMLADLLGKKE